MHYWLSGVVAGLLVWVFPLDSYACPGGMVCPEGQVCTQPSDCITPGSPSTSGEGASTSPTTGPSTAPTTDPTTVKEQMGVTLNPDASGGKGKSATDPNLVGVGLPKVDKFNLIFGNDLAGQYVRFLNYLKELNEAKKEAKMNERVRRASWEKNSGLDHAREQFDRTHKRWEDAQKKSRVAEDKADEAMTDYSNWERQRDWFKRELRGQEVGSNQWYDTLENSHKWEKKEPDLRQARQDAWDKFQETRKEAEQLRGELRANLNRINEAMDRYKDMEANYQSSRNVPIPKPRD